MTAHTPQRQQGRRRVGTADSPSKEEKKDDAVWKSVQHLLKLTASRKQERRTPTRVLARCHQAESANDVQPSRAYGDLQHLLRAVASSRTAPFTSCNCDYKEITELRPRVCTLTGVFIILRKRSGRSPQHLLAHHEPPQIGRAHV